jgi:hypothetical protein
MKKILVLFLAIVIIAGASIGFGATLDSNAIDPGNIANIGQNYGDNTNTNQNDEISDEIDQSRSDTADTGPVETNYQNEGNDQNENWYDGFWDNKNNGYSGFWKDEDCDGLGSCNKDEFCDDDDDKCCDDDDECDDDDDECDDDDDDGDNKIDIKNEINNHVTVTANGGDSKSNVEMGLASGSKTNQITGEIKEFNYKNESDDNVPLQETGLPIVPALLSVLFIGSSLLYKKLRK